MLNATVHQANGLKRLQETHTTRVLPVTSALAGAGRRTVAYHLAAACTRPRASALILDSKGGDLLHRHRCSGDADLIDLLNGKLSYGDAIATTRDGVSLLAAERGLARLALQSDSAAAGVALFRGFASLSAPPRHVFVDTPCDQADAILALLDGHGEVLVVMTPAPHAITETYRLIKRLSREPGLQFRILVNRGDALDAKRSYCNLAEVARCYVGMRLEYAGHVPYDASLRAPRMQCSSAVTTAFRQLAQHLLRWSLPGFDPFPAAILSA